LLVLAVVSDRIQPQDLYPVGGVERNQAPNTLGEPDRTLVVQKSLERFGMRVAVVERGIVWDAQVPKAKATPCQHPSSIVNCIPN
jgi:hypothetical protein